MKIFFACLFSAVVFAQAPIGNLRVRLGNTNSTAHYPRTAIATDSGMWDLSMASGGSVATLAGQATSLTLSGTGTTSGGLTFNGTSDFAYVSGDTVDVQPTTTFSLTTLGKFSAQTDGTFFSKWGAGGTSNTMISACGEGINSLKCQCHLAQGSDGTQIIATDPSNSYAVGTWFVLQCVADGSALRTYVNGNQVASAAYNGTVGDGPNYMVLGSLNNALWYLNGAIAFADYRKYPFTPVEVKQSYRAIKAAYCSSYGSASALCTDLPVR